MTLDPQIPAFEDLDKQDIYDKCYRALENIDTLNFAIEFDSEHAQAALNLDVVLLQKLLDVRVRLPSAGM